MSESVFTAFDISFGEPELRRRVLVSLFSARVNMCLSLLILSRMLEDE
jgi:hypothetical protein